MIGRRYISASFCNTSILPKRISKSPASIFRSSVILLMTEYWVCFNPIRLRAVCGRSMPTKRTPKFSSRSMVCKVWPAKAAGAFIL